MATLYLSRSKYVEGSAKQFEQEDEIKSNMKDKKKHFSQQVGNNSIQSFWIIYCVIWKSLQYGTFETAPRFLFSGHQLKL